MCGIFGVWGHQRAAALAHLGLYSLQHRGQESAGIVWVGPDGGARSVRKMGLVSDGFDEVANVSGSVALGHTRYSTAGSSTLDNAQPVMARFRDGHISLAHNGNLVNEVELRRDLEDRGSIFSSSMDSEVIVHLMARSQSTKPEHKLADALSRVEGASSLLVLMGSTLMAARDPRGWRPLVMGRLDGSYVFASETCALDIVGATVEREGQAGRDHRHRSRRIPHAADADLAAQALRLRARLLRAAGQLRLRRFGRSRPSRVRPAVGQGAAGARCGPRLFGA
jgi:amidophosphoribosyltransferase